MSNDGYYKFLRQLALSLSIERDIEVPTWVTGEVRLEDIEASIIGMLDLRAGTGLVSDIKRAGSEDANDAYSPQNARELILEQRAARGVDEKPDGKATIEFNATPVVWVRVSVKVPGVRHPVPTETYRELQKFMRENEIWPAILAGGGGPWFLEGGYTQENANKIAHWLKTHGVPVLSEHDRARRDKALACDRDDIESVADAVRGLQSTDDPSLTLLYDELVERYNELKKKGEA